MRVRQAQDRGEGSPHPRLPHPAGDRGGRPGLTRFCLPACMTMTAAEAERRGRRRDRARNAPLSREWRLGEGAIYRTKLCRLQLPPPAARPQASPAGLACRGEGQTPRRPAAGLGFPWDMAGSTSRATLPHLGSRGQSPRSVGRAPRGKAGKGADSREPLNTPRPLRPQLPPSSGPRSGEAGSAGPATAQGPARAPALGAGAGVPRARSAAISLAQPLTDGSLISPSLIFPRPSTPCPRTSVFSGPIRLEILDGEM